MLRSVTFSCLVLIGAATAHASTIVDFTGTSTGLNATGTATISLSADGTSIVGTLTNTSPFDAQITAFGFDLGAGDLSGFTGTPTTITDPGDANFVFQDDDLGNVPQFGSIELDFGYLTGDNFAGGDPNSGLDNFFTLNFTITGPFEGFTEAEIASGLLVRFQRVGESGELSDVSRPTPVPEPATMILLGTGLLYAARKRLRRQDA